MILLDTNVLSEMMKGRDADPDVIAWVWALPEAPATTVFNRAEILAGIELLPEGRRRGALEDAAHRVLDRIGVCLPFTAECATTYAAVVAECHRRGRPIASMDALIASVAREVEATLATRNVRDFADLGIEIVDPWALRSG